MILAICGTSVPIFESVIVAVDPEVFVGRCWLRQPMESRAVVGAAVAAVAVGTFVVVVIVPVAVETGDRSGGRIVLMMHVLVVAWV